MRLAGREPTYLKYATLNECALAWRPRIHPARGPALPYALEVCNVNFSELHRTVAQVQLGRGILRRLRRLPRADPTFTAAATGVSGSSYTTACTIPHPVSTAHTAACV